MITTTKGEEIETFSALIGIAQALDTRFPDGHAIFQRVSRLAEECGELASAVNHRENMGIKKQKHGEASDEHMIKELQDVLRVTLDIARYYKLEDKLEQSIEERYQAYQKDGFIR